MRRLKLITFAALILLLSGPMALAQMDGYGNYPTEKQTTNSPAGSAVEHHSYFVLLFLFRFPRATSIASAPSLGPQYCRNGDSHSSTSESGVASIA